MYNYIFVFNKHLRVNHMKNNLTKREYDESKASSPHYDKYMIFKLLIIHIFGIFYNYCYL